jgi:hypothetical protein
MAYNVAMAIVNRALQAVSFTNPMTGQPSSVYALAVYNLAGDNLINYAQDIPNAPNVQGSVPPAPYFINLRQRWNVYGFVSGVIQSASDEGTSTSFVVQEAAENFTLSNLQNLKTPYGRAYLAFAQSYGTLWGMN